MDIHSWQQKGQHFPYRGHQVFFVTEGSGPPLLLLHGFPTSSWDWYKLWPDLTSRYTVLAPDFIGFGFSDKPCNYPYHLMDQADLVVSLVERQEMKEVHLLAHDYGDTVAQELLARQGEGSLPFRIVTTTLLNGGLFPGVHKPRLIQKLLMTPLGPLLGRLYSKRSFHRTMDNIFGAATPPSQEEIDSFWELMNRQEGKLVVHKIIRYMAERVTHQKRWLEALQEASCPLRLIDGAADPISGAHLVAHYEKVIPQPDCITLEGIGHYPQVEAPGAVLEAFNSFVDAHNNR